MKQQQLSVSDAINRYGLPDFGLDAADRNGLHEFLIETARLRIYNRYGWVESVEGEYPNHFCLVQQGLFHAYYNCPHSGLAV